MDYRHYIRNVLRVFFFMLVFAVAGFASWKKIATLQEPVSCVYFTDPSHGFAGTGSQAQELTLQIWYTTNGGVTWTQAGTPVGGSGRVTQIVIRPDGVGYA